MKTFLLALFLMSAFYSCSSTAKLLKERNYPAVIDVAIERLSTNSNDRKAQQNLKQAYNGAMDSFQSEITRFSAGNDSLRWSKTLDIMQQSNDLSDKIRKSTVALKVVGEPRVYTTEFEDAKKKAVEELFVVGKASLNQNTKEKAKQAFFLFKKVAGLAPDYNGINTLISNSQIAATDNVVIDPVQIEFNTLAVSTKKIDKELFYWTQRDVSTRPFIRFYMADDAEKQDVDPDFYIRIDVQDYRVEKMSSAQAGSGTSNLMAIGNLYLKIYSVEKQKVVFKKGISCRYDAQTRSTIRVNTIDLQRVIDPDIQTFFDYMLLSNFDRITEEIYNYFSTLAKQ